MVAGSESKTLEPSYKQEVGGSSPSLPPGIIPKTSNQTQAEGRPAPEQIKIAPFEESDEGSAQSLCGAASDGPSLDLEPIASHSSGRSIRCRPKKIASADQDPGPNMASARPMAPKRIELRGVGEPRASSEASASAQATPEIGVQRPIRRMTPRMAENSVSSPAAW